MSLDAAVLRRAARDGLVICGVLLGLAQATGLVAAPGDALAYYQARLADPYAHSTLAQGAGYLYSPAFAQALQPLRLLPWPAFLVVWTSLLTLCLAYLAGPWGWPLLVVIPILSSIGLGNIELLIALAIVVGFRWPAAWAFVLLTKVTPGIGLLWFVFRGEWRRLAVALGATGLLALVSFVLAPGLWVQWWDVLVRNTSVTFPEATFPGPLWLRLLVSAALLFVAARLDWLWMVPIAAAISTPVAYFTLLAVALPGAAAVLRRVRPVFVPSGQETLLEGRRGGRWSTLADRLLRPPEVA